MDCITFKFPLKAFSINAMYYRDRSVIAADAREWQYKVLMYLEDPKVQHDIKEFKEHFDAKNHGLEITIYSCYPKEMLFAKNGKLTSNGVIDLSNCEKPIIDLLTAKRYSTEGRLNLEIDDKNAISLISKKAISDTIAIVVNFKTINHSDLQTLKFS